MPGDPNATTWKIPNPAMVESLPGQPGTRISVLGCGRARGYQRTMARHPIRILGIDPGLRRTGWGLIESDGNRLIHIACGSLETSERAELGTRLLVIHDGLISVIERYRPHEAAVEATFVNTNAAATLKLGQARGIAMLVPAKAGLTVAEYAPNLVKKTVVGAGHGEKTQIRMMIGVLLPKADPKSEDAADALAIAVCHAHHRTSAARRYAAQA
jgi:crossover junction endodeoxyribonuclease RuvC